MKITFAAPAAPATGSVVATVYEGGVLSASAKTLDDATKGALSRAIKAAHFKGSAKHSLTVLTPGGSKLDRVVLMGLGKAAKADALALQALGGRAFKALNTHARGGATIMVDAIDGCTLNAPEIAAEIGYGALLAAYTFDKYRTKKKSHGAPPLKSLSVQSMEPAKARKAFSQLSKIADGVFLTRDLVSEPANVLYPETLAEHAKDLSKLGVTVEVLDKKKIKSLGMGALLGVAQGSAHDPRVVVMQWVGAPADKGKNPEAPIAFIGKGVTFDSGGISIKPSAGMEDMKWDMGGAGVVIGLMKALAGRKAKVNVVGIVGLVENMPSGTAQRPGDIVTSMSGQTIEVLNTDAEGRLVLADALWYCKERFKPKAMIDLATLTGAIIVALGSEHAGLFSNNDALSEQITAAGKAVGEHVWRLPMGTAYDKMLDSQVADVQNISSGGRGAGSITAAQFLKRFVGDVPWAHIDIAGVTWSKTDAPTRAKGATGFGVRLLDRFVAEYGEK
ncbi:leucyl aminopeptidase [Varunaivibrio sulfuroxidans]|uniref:Probable cytosol aminopeptidase n=1 Tax=Varunaivibrio sulfuroxidans TaxID=1773489 RepID=A0A4R3J699_9PROT|nr:leucyl aminopeptidase [Varunaivibrio sulfuroxidans]TCS60383.1 leucyl aminopeptidase [Varunaivibrio sulfuroxidans]WES30930.1 leucyl aminopeptidase [Varunaivibrio sulfuroxidans]